MMIDMLRSNTDLDALFGFVHVRPSRRRTAAAKSQPSARADVIDLAPRRAERLAATQEPGGLRR